MRGVSSRLSASSHGHGVDAPFAAPSTDFATSSGLVPVGLHLALQPVRLYTNDECVPRVSPARLPLSIRSLAPLRARPAALARPAAGPLARCRPARFAVCRSDTAGTSVARPWHRYGEMMAFFEMAYRLQWEDTRLFNHPCPCQRGANLKMAAER